MFKRKIIEQILPVLYTHDILLFYWARQVWKTTLMEILQNDYIKTRSCFLDLENLDLLNILNQWPIIFIEYLKSAYDWNEEEEFTVFIDEVQYLNEPTSLVKYIHDHYKKIKLILSWSSTLEIRKKMKDSLAWRMFKFDIYPLSFEEFLIFKWKDNLAKHVGSPSEFNIIDKELAFFYNEYLLFWWYPRVALTNGIDEKKRYIKQIYDSYIQKDIKDIWKINDIEAFNKCLKVLATQVGNLVNYSELSNKIWVSLANLKNRMLILENTFVTKTILPWSGNIRGELIRTPKLFFIDSWIRNYCINDFTISWATFENSFFMYINNAYKVEKTRYFRTKEKQEIDFILDDIPYELKLKYEWKGLLALSRFEEETKNEGKVITLDKWNKKWRKAFYPREI